MRTWLISAALALLLVSATVMVGLAATPATPTPLAEKSPSASAPTAAPTVAPTSAPTSPSVQQTVQAQVAAAATRAPATATPTAPPTPTEKAAPTTAPAATPATAPPSAASVQQTVEAQVAAASKSPSKSASPTETPPATGTPAPSTKYPGARSAFSVAGIVYLDFVGSGYVDGVAGVPDVQVHVVGPTGREWQTKTDPQGIFKIEGLPAGTYHLSIVVPQALTARAGAEQDVQVAQSVQDPFLFGLAPADPTAAPVGASDPPMLAVVPPSDATATPSPSDTLTADSPDTGEQEAATISVGNLPIRFAPGRDTLAQVARRTLTDGSIWLGVPFRTQIDGTEYQYVNCGPASLTMVLAGFGLDVGPDEVRNYLNSLTQDYSTDTGTSLDVLSAIARQAGLVPIDLYSNQGGYRAWSTDAIRWHVQQGHPVITLVKYHDLPGHFQSPAESDHYIVITGLTPDGFIYNDAAFASTVGYGLEIKETELETAWDNSSIPHNGVALALPQDGAILSFPEQPKPTPELRDVQGGPLVGTGRDGELADEQALLPTPAVAQAPAPAPIADSVQAAVQQDTTDPPTLDPTTVEAAPVPQPQVAVDQDPGPRHLVPDLFVILGTLWAGAMGWSAATLLARRLPGMGAGCARVVALLACFHLF